MKNIKFNRDQFVNSQCHVVQMDGLQACKTCPHKDAPANSDEACMSPEIRKTGKNAAGFEVPLKQRQRKLDTRQGRIQK